MPGGGEKGFGARTAQRRVVQPCLALETIFRKRGASIAGYAILGA